MLKFEFVTGRDYGQLQVIQVTIRKPIVRDEFGFTTFEAEFWDNVRNIHGKCDCIAFGDTEREYAKAVLAEYDAGRYAAI